MAKLPVNGVVAFDKVNLTTSVNTAAVEYSADEIDQTCFQDAYHNFLAGPLKTGILSGGGFIEFPDPDSTLNSSISVADCVATIAAGASEGDAAWFMKSLLSKYTPRGKIGDALGFDFAAGCSTSPLVRGYLAGYGSKAATGNTTTPIRIGTLSATETMYAALHVISAPGTTLDVIIQSDDNSGMTTPTTRMTFTQVTTTAGAQFSSVAGAITDDYWRARWTISGGPYFLIVSIGKIV